MMLLRVLAVCASSIAVASMPQAAGLRPPQHVVVAGARTAGQPPCVHMLSLGRSPGDIVVTWQSATHVARSHLHVGPSPTRLDSAPPATSSLLPNNNDDGHAWRNISGVHIRDVQPAGSAAIADDPAARVLNFTARAPHGSSGPASFAIFGDLGLKEQEGANCTLARLKRHLALPSGRGGHDICHICGGCPPGTADADATCPNVGCHSSQTVQQCETLCDERRGCNAFNFASEGCCLRACPAGERDGPPPQSVDGCCAYFHHYNNTNTPSSLKTDDTRSARPIVQWVSPATGPNQTLWISGSNLDLADATLCRTPAHQCIHYTTPSADFGRWPTQMRLVVPGCWPQLARYSLSLSLASGSESTTTNLTVNGPIIHWWLSSELNGQAQPGGWVRIYGENLALGSDAQPKARTEGCVDPRKPRTGADTVSRLRLCCGGPGCTWFELAAQSEDCNSVEFRVLDSAVHTSSTSCVMRLGNLQLEGKLIVQKDWAKKFRRILPDNATDLIQALAERTNNTVLALSGVYRMSGASLRVSTGVTLQGPAELIYETATWLPESVCLLGQLGFAAPAWGMVDVTVTIAANISCNTAGGLDTPANAAVCMGGSGSTVLRSTIRSIRSPGSRFCHLFHASGASALSIANSTFDLRMDQNQRALPRVLSIDNCSRVLIEGNTLFSDAEGWIISSSNRVAFTGNVCNSSISDGSHGNTLGTYHPPARLDNIIVNRNTIVNQGTTMDGPGQSWSPLALPNSSLGHYGPVRQGASTNEFELVGATLGDAALFEGMGLVVMSGTGVEQIRRVVSVRAGRFVTVDKPLEVTLDHTSVVALTLYRHRVAVVGNSFSTRMKDIMFWIYGGCSECAVSYNNGVGNQPANTTEIGLALWPRSIHGLIEVVHRTVMTDNAVKKFGTVGLVGGLENYLPMLHNCSLATGRSIVIRRNVVDDGSWMVVTPGPTRYINLIGAVLEGNQITGFNTAVGAVPIAITNSTSRLTIRRNYCNNSLCGHIKTDDLTDSGQCTMPLHAARCTALFDIRNVSAPSVAGCCAACMAEPTCKYFEYEIVTHTARCWLKTSGAGPKRHDSCISGVKSPSPSGCYRRHHLRRYLARAKMTTAAHFVARATPPQGIARAIRASKVSVVNCLQWACP